jgi:ribose transport system permease protein
MLNTLNAKKGIAKKSKDRIMYFISFLAIFLLIIIFTSMESSFVNKANLSNLLSDTAPLMVMAAGMTFVIMLGSIDLSTGGVCSVANVLVVKYITELSSQISNIYLVAVIAYTIAIVFGILAGLMMGFLQAKLKMPSFIASLGFMSIWKSVALLISEAPVSIPKVGWTTINWAKIDFGIVGLPLILALVLIVFFYIMQKRTVFGKSIMAIGGNERAARMSGISVAQTKIMAFMINGFCAALGGIFLAAKLKSSAPTIGDAFVLLVVASVVLGGTALSGGKGSVAGTILGVFTVAIIRNGMNIVGVDVFWQNIVFGLVVLGAIAITTDRSGRNLVIK